LQMGFDIVCTMSNDKTNPKYFKSKSSGPYRQEGNIFYRLSDTSVNLFLFTNYPK
jgi:hypothetical protein